MLWMVNKGIYVVRFRSMENRDMIRDENAPFVYSKRKILKAWNADVDICKENVKTFPISVQMPLIFGGNFPVKDS